MPQGDTSLVKQVSSKSQDFIILLLVSPQAANAITLAVRASIEIIAIILRYYTFVRSARVIEDSAIQTRRDRNEIGLDPQASLDITVMSNITDDA